MRTRVEHEKAMWKIKDVGQIQIQVMSDKQHKQLSLEDKDNRKRFDSVLAISADSVFEGTSATEQYKQLDDLEGMKEQTNSASASFSMVAIQPPDFESIINDMSNSHRKHIAILQKMKTYFDRHQNDNDYITLVLLPSVKNLKAKMDASRSCTDRFLRHVNKDLEECDVNLQRIRENTKVMHENKESKEEQEFIRNSENLFRVGSDLDRKSSMREKTQTSFADSIASAMLPPTVMFAAVTQWNAFTKKTPTNVEEHECSSKKVQNEVVSHEQSSAKEIHENIATHLTELQFPRRKFETDKKRIVEKKEKLQCYHKRIEELCRETQELHNSLCNFMEHLESIVTYKASTH